MVRDYSRIKVAALGAAAGIAAVAAAGALVSKARRDISQFGQSIADLSAITGAAGRDLAFYSEQAQEIGRTTSLSASQAVEAFKLIGSAKPDLLGSADALNQVTREAVTLAEAAGIDLPNAASALGSALNQFQLDATKSNEVINILAASAKFGAAEIPAVTEALRNAGPAANALSVDLAETVAGIQGLAIAGRQGADAGTGLRQVLLRLEKTADAQLQPSVVGLTGALLELERRNLSNTELMELFGDEAFTAGTALLTQAGNVEKLNSQLRGTETATEQASIRMDTLKGDGLELDSAIEGLSITFGEKLEPALRSSTQWLTEFINKITEAVGGQTIASLEEEIASLEE
ncbi:MAG TPA: phage tail tape measure protein, partial [Methylophaga sp.]|nr:phage tail tape measure protein [Methylophaga sp.]